MSEGESSATLDSMRGKLPSEAIDSRVFLYDVPWSEYERLDRIRGERSVPRLSYLDGMLELMSPSTSHERIGWVIGRCLEIWADENDIDVGACGRWTVKRSKGSAGAEADESYIFGRNQKKRRPDLAIEVIWTHGGLEKLDIWRRLRVPEVWVWRDGRISIFGLGRRGYRKRRSSRFARGLDVRLIEPLVDEQMVKDVFRAFRRALRVKRRR